MYACFRREEAADATVMLDAAAAVLAEYTPDVIRYVTDPRTGLPGRLKWPPNIAEIKEACEKRNAELHLVDQRERAWDVARQRAALPPPDRSQRPSYEDLKQHYGGDTWGINPPPEPIRQQAISHYRTDRPLSKEERDAMYAARRNQGA